MEPLIVKFYRLTVADKKLLTMIFTHFNKMYPNDDISYFIESMTEKLPIRTIYITEGKRARQFKTAVIYLCAGGCLTKEELDMLDDGFKRLPSWMNPSYSPRCIG